MNHLILNLESPLMSFGGETIDNLGVIRWFPAVSMLTGLLANALGWRRVDRERHQDLQDRLVFAARIDREPAGGVRLTDFQTAQLGANDRGWTTRGAPDERAGGANTYLAPHLRWRDYFADMRVSVALRLEPSEQTPTLEDLAVALDEPVRPLFIGRKPCLPSAPLYGGNVGAGSVIDALLQTPLEVEQAPERVRLIWPSGEEPGSHVRLNDTHILTDQRNWVSGLHGGGRWVCEGTSARDDFPAGLTETPGKEGTV